MKHLRDVFVTAKTNVGKSSMTYVKTFCAELRVGNFALCQPEKQKVFATVLLQNGKCVTFSPNFRSRRTELHRIVS